jgi:NADP-dependent 3-hydroxy acid dehydrogenase YdfG
VIFLITGASAGFGRAFAEAALEAGHTEIQAWEPLSRSTDYI